MITLKKILQYYKEKKLLSLIIKKLSPYFDGLLLYFLPKKDKESIKIHIPKTNIIDENDLKLAERIFVSLKKMKHDQMNCDQNFKPSSMWENHVRDDYKILNESLKDNNIKKFLFFLSNFGNSKNYIGIENQDFIKKLSKNFLLKNYLKNRVFGGLLKNWKYFGFSKNDLDKLNQPKFGNQNGAIINKNFVTIGSFFCHIYSDLLNNFIKKKNRPIIADLGAGYGKLAYYILKDRKEFCFIDFDLPEVLSLATFYLMKIWPNKKTLLYGEKNFTNNDLNNYDLIFLPSFEIEKLKNNSVDLFVNKNSLGEMMPNTSKKLVENICRTTKTFFHINHETERNFFEDGSKSLLNKEYPVPSNFDLLFRYPDLAHMTYDSVKINYESDIFVYCYQKNMDI